MKKLFALLLAVIMVLGLVACTATPAVTDPTTTGNNNATDNTDGNTTTTADSSVKVEFPLEEEVTLTLLAEPRNTVKDMEKNLAQNKLWQDLYKRTNVKIQIRRCPSLDTLQAMMQTGDYGDIIMTQGLSNDAVSELAGSGKLLVLDEYVANRGIMPNINERVFDELPEARGTFNMPDGHMYCFGSYNAEKSTYLESSIWINYDWLKDSGRDVEDISTLEGLEEWFAWIMANDCNGDGDTTDELPYYAYPMGGGFVEALLGMWGMPTKNMVNQNYVTVVDGEVVFVPTTDNYKDFLATMAEWYQKGWIHKDYIKGHTNENYEYLMNRYIRANGQPERVAFYTGTGGNYRNQNAKDENGNTKLPADQIHEYISILPPTVEGYETRWYIHPGYMGTKGAICVAANTQYPEIVCAWIDQFYSYEVASRQSVGEEGSPWRITYEDGTIGTTNLTNDVQAQVLESDQNRLDQIITGWPIAKTKEDIETKYYTGEGTKKKREALEAYADIIDKEPWPNPYIAPDEAARLNELKGDLKTLTEEFLYKVMAGEYNLESDWNTYQFQLQQLKLDEFMEILQDTYDGYLAGLETLK